jgi:hypothetical protein
MIHNANKNQEVNMKLREMKIGDTAYTKSHEGIKERRNGEIVDLWEGSKGQWCANVKISGNKIICVRDSDLIN